MKNNLKYLIYAIFTSIIVYIPYDRILDVKNFASAFYNSNSFILAVGTILLFLFYKKTGNIKLGKLKSLLCLIFSFYVSTADVYKVSESLSILSKDPLILILFIIKFIGIVYLLRICFFYLDKFINNLGYYDRNIKFKPVKWYMDKLKKKPFLVSFVSMLIIFSVYLIVFYPGVLSPDPTFQIYEYFNIPTKYSEQVNLIDPNIFLTNHHPVFVTYLLGWCIELGRFILNDNFGLFIYVIIQTLLSASVLSYTIKFMKDNKVPNVLYFSVLLMYLFVPMYGMYNVAFIKDTLYTYFFILYVLMLFDFVKNYNKEKILWPKLLKLLLVCIMLTLTRNNGIYVILLSLPFSLFIIKYNFKRLLAVLLLLLVFNVSYTKVFLPSLGITSGSIKEVLSVPFQQTARLVKYHEEKLTEEDKEIINKVLKYDSLAELYDPSLSDHVKDTYNKNATTEELIEYFKVWFNKGLENPLTYIEATFLNTNGYLSPNIHKWYLHTNPKHFMNEEETVHVNVIDYKLNDVFKGPRGVIRTYGDTFPYIPIVGLLSNIGFSGWSLLILSVYVLQSNNKKYFLTLLPMLASILVCFVGPANTYFRYTMPYMFLLPTMWCLLIKYIRKDNNYEER